MPPIVLTALQGLLLLLLYIFVARAVRAVVRDLRAPRPAPARAPAASSGGATRPQQQGAPRPQAAPAGGRDQRSSPGELVVHTANGRPKVLRLDREEVTFGRADSSTVPLGDPYVSDRHARVYRDGSRWLVADLGSTNGTFLNQHKVTRPTPISAGDQLGIGKTRVEVRR